MPLVYGGPRIVARIWEAHKHSRIGDVFFLHPFPTKHEVGEHTVGKPPETHSSVASRDAVFEREVARTALGPAFRGRFAEKRYESGIAVLLCGNVRKEGGGNLVDGACLDLAVVHFRGFGLELD